MAKRKTRITIETHSLTILRTQGRATIRWCDGCGAETQMIPAELAANLCSVTQRMIFRMVEVDRLHFAETPAGEMLICVESLRGLI